jgi:uncharacterized damage-inducible protein DinB
MDSEIRRTLGQIEGSFGPGAWHGPSIRELLAAVTAELAAGRIAPGTHSIWELVLHIAAWEDATRRMVEGGSGEVSDERNFPALPGVSEAAWQAAITALNAGHEALLAAVARLSDAQLGRTVTGKSYTFYFLLHGVVQHNLYHAGQIALLKRALERQSPGNK